MIFGIALNALPGPASVTTPDYITHELVGHLQPDAVPAHVQEYRDTAVKMLGMHVGEHWFGPTIGRFFGFAAAGIFALLLLSAVNTAIMAKVSVMYSMAHDRELPRPLTRLNYSGVPWIGLVVACVLPLCILVFEADVKALGELYAIGVVGAITINFLCCAVNKNLVMARWERAGLWILGLLMAVIEATICWAKPHALMFAGSMIAVVLTVRFGMRFYSRRKAEALPVPVPEHGWLSEIRREPLPVDPSRPRIMLAARGRGQAEFAVDLARRRGATLFVMYVRTLRVLDLAPGTVPQVEDDPQALESLGAVVALAHRYRVPVQPIYICALDVAAEVLDYTVTFGCDTLILGKSRRRAFARAIEGDVVTQIVKDLPSEVALITRDASPHPMGPEPERHKHEPPPPAQPTEGERPRV
jgi:nucleotide-binding universal stress UspA family protein